MLCSRIFSRVWKPFLGYKIVSSHTFFFILESIFPRGKRYGSQSWFSLWFLLIGVFMQQQLLFKFLVPLGLCKMDWGLKTLSSLSNCVILKLTMERHTKHQCRALWLAYWFHCKAGMQLLAAYNEIVNNIAVMQALMGMSGGAQYSSIIECTSCNLMLQD